MTPSTTIWREVADQLGCDIPTIKAVFEVEAAGKFYESDGSLPRRFEPHHFPEQHWDRLGFSPREKQAPWRASKSLTARRRARMFKMAENLDAEAAYQASSWGAPQTMGFNHELAGYESATNMVRGYEKSADAQVRGFVAFVVNSGLDTHLRSQDWYSFARGYNGSGQPDHYAGLIESAYRRHSGGNPSSSLLRVGRSGRSVEKVQELLVDAGHEITVDGVFGRETLEAVREFQESHQLKVDGIVGGSTQRKLEEVTSLRVNPPKDEQQRTNQKNQIDKILSRGTAVLGSGGITGLLTSLDPMAQNLVIGAAVLGGFGLATIYLINRWS